MSGQSTYVPASIEYSNPSGVMLSNGSRPDEGGFRKRNPRKLVMSGVIVGQGGTPGSETTSVAHGAPRTILRSAESAGSATEASFVGKPGLSAAMVTDALSFGTVISKSPFGPLLASIV